MLRRIQLLPLTIVALTCACSWDYPIWIPRSPSADPYYRFIKNGYGYMDTDGQILIPPSFEYAEDFHDGRVVVGKKDGPFWYINEHGQRAFDGDCVVASPFFKGLAHVKVSGDRYSQRGTFAYINTSGKQVFTYKP
jgi:hypothetical protein